MLNWLHRSPVGHLKPRITKAAAEIKRQTAYKTHEGERIRWSLLIRAVTSDQSEQEVTGVGGAWSR